METVNLAFFDAYLEAWNEHQHNELITEAARW